MGYTFRALAVTSSMLGREPGSAGAVFHGSDAVASLKPFMYMDDGNLYDVFHGSDAVASLKLYL